MVTSPLQPRVEQWERTGNPIAELVVARSLDQRTAYVEGASGRGLTWAELAGRVDAWHDWAADLGGVGRLGLLIADPVEMIVAVLGALAAGVAIAPLDPGATRRELAAKVEVLGLSAIVTDRDSDDRVTPLEWIGSDIEHWGTGPDGLVLARAGRVRDTTGRPGPADLRPESERPTGGVLLMASSGTSGTPKLIALGADQLLHTARAVVEHHGLNPDDRAYSPLPLFHINGLVVGVLSALVGGHRLVVDRHFSASKCWEIVGRNEVTWLNLVPAILSVLARRPAPPPEVRARIRFARSASAPLAAATLEAFEARTGILIVETYGMTEAGSQITANSPTEPGRRPGSVGVPVGVELRIVDDRQVPVLASITGQIEIRGPSVVSSYLMPVGSSSSTRPAGSADGWLPTGDLGYRDADGYVYLIGRADDVINRGGEKVYPREIEEVLLADVAVSAAAVAGRADPMFGEVPVAFVLADGSVDSDALVARLEVRCERELSRPRRPVEIVVTDQLPTGANGKIRRSELRRLLARHGRE